MIRRVPEDALMEAFQTITRITDEYFEEIAGTVSPGMHRGVLGPLMVVHQEGPQRVNALAERLGLDRTTITRHLNELERRGLLQRVPDEADRRAVLAQLTGVARERLDAAQRDGRRRMGRIYADWDPTDQAMFRDLLTRFVSSAATLSGFGDP